MEAWVVFLISVCVCAVLRAIIHALISLPSNSNLPPGPPKLPVITTLRWLWKSPMDFESTLRSLHAKYGPIVTIFIGPNPSVFIADRAVVHKALVQNGALFADRPPALSVSKITSSNQMNISSAFYGATWRLFRRNLTSEILNPSRVKSYMHARKWVLDFLFDRLLSQSQSGNPVRVVDHFQYAMFCLLVLMCFGDKLDENQIKEIEDMQRGLLLGFRRFSVLNFWPRLTKVILFKRWQEFLEMKKKQAAVLVPLIEARKTAKQEALNKAKDDDQNRGEEFVLSYVDTLLDLELPEEKRKLDNNEIISLCSEFLDAGTDTTSTALQWVMANLVKHPEIQQKLYEEMKGVVGTEARELKEEHLGKLPYLKGVVLEGLRRHPPGHFVLPHAVREDTELEGYKIPKKGTVNFTVAEMGRDPKVWEDPMEFKPERFMNGELDITGSKEIKMMPFGAGRRICPGVGLALLHLEYFVGNLVWRFEWKAVEGDEVDLSEKAEFTVVMKKPLQALVNPRF